MAIIMLYMANKMLAVKKHLEKEVLGTYTKQLEEMEKIEKEIYGSESSTYNLPE